MLSELKILADSERKRHPELMEEINNIVVYATENVLDGADEESEQDQAILEIEWLLGGG